MVAKEAMPDQVHLFVRVGPTDARAQVVRAFKGGTARVLRAEFPCLGRRARVLWSPSYLAASVGCVSESTVRRTSSAGGTR
jgi:putative transposase